MISLSWIFKITLVKAVVITKPGAPEVLKLQERETPQPKPTEVLIRVKAAGVNEHIGKIMLEV